MTTKNQPIPIPGPEMVTITVTREDAEALRYGLSDLLCWCAGFTAALGDDCSRAPYGVTEARELGLRLRTALNRSAR